jgi:hypothetical protein
MFIYYLKLSGFLIKLSLIFENQDFGVFQAFSDFVLWPFIRFKIFMNGFSRLSDGVLTSIMRPRCWLKHYLEKDLIQFYTLFNPGEKNEHGYFVHSFFSLSQGNLSRGFFCLKILFFFNSVDIKPKY